MKPTDCQTAWAHHPTRKVWFRHMALNALALLAWAGGWIALLGVSTKAPNWAVWIFMPYFIYAPYRVYLLAKGSIPTGIRMWRVLTRYPWQVLQDVPRGLAKHPSAEKDGMWFEFRNPTDSDQEIPLVFHDHMRSHWWMKRIGGPRTSQELKSQIEPLWVSGDPRFAAVISAQGKNESPKRLHFLYQRAAISARYEYRGWTVTQPDLESARGAGARVPARGREGSLEKPAL